MKASVIPRPPEPSPSERLIQREGAYRFFLEVDDTDYGHARTAGGHRFPCTRVQLRQLREAITRALGGRR